MRTLADRRQISALFVHHGPVVLARDAEAAGISRSVLRRSTDRGELTRLGKAAFVSTSAFEAASPWEAFRLRSVAFSLSSGPDTFLTGPAAAAVLEIPMVGDPPDHPTALRPGNAHIGHDRSPYGRVASGGTAAGSRAGRGRTASGHARCAHSPAAGLSGGRVDHPPSGFPTRPPPRGPSETCPVRTTG